MDILNASVHGTETTIKFGLVLVAVGNKSLAEFQSDWVTGWNYGPFFSCDGIAAVARLNCTK